MNKRMIAHVDMDAFFAAVEQRDDPALRGKPVIIGADPKRGRGRGVVSTCSYEARPFGIHSAMPISEAYRRCPHGIFLRGNYGKYKEASRQVLNIFYQYTPIIQPISIDEAFLDLTGCTRHYGSVRKIGQAIKEHIKREVNLTASIGLASNKMIAKIASDYHKPDGLCIVKPSEIMSFLHPLGVERLWGVGKKSQQALHQLNIMTIGDLARWERAALRKRFGDFGDHLYHLAHGIDDRPVEMNCDIKSVSHEHTFEEDVDDKKVLERTLLHLTEKVSRRLRRHDLKGRTITLKIRLQGFKTFTRSHTIDHRTNYVQEIYAEARRLLNNFFQTGMMVRLIGVKVDQFYDQYLQESLFKNPNEDKQEAMHQAVDRLKDRFGENAISWGV